jgi:hypothetical protein
MRLGLLTGLWISTLCVLAQPLGAEIPAKELCSRSCRTGVCGGSAHVSFVRAIIWRWPSRFRTSPRYGFRLLMACHVRQPLHCSALVVRREMCLLAERPIWITDAHRDDGKRFVVRSEEKLTAFPELERITRESVRFPNAE